MCRCLSALDLDYLTCLRFLKSSGRIGFGYPPQKGRREGTIRFECQFHDMTGMSGGVVSVRNAEEARRVGNDHMNLRPSTTYIHSTVQLCTLNLPSLNTSNSALASRHRRARVDVPRGNRVVRVKQNARVRCAVRAGERHQVTRLDAPAAARDIELRARDVQLRAVGRRRAVQRNVLDAEEVLAVLDALGDAHRDLGFAWEPNVSLVSRTKPAGGMDKPSLSQLNDPVPSPRGWSCAILNHTAPLPLNVAAVWPAGTLAR